MKARFIVAVAAIAAAAVNQGYAQDWDGCTTTITKGEDYTGDVNLKNGAHITVSGNEGGDPQVIVTGTGAINISAGSRLDVMGDNAGLYAPTINIGEGATLFVSNEKEFNFGPTATAGMDITGYGSSSNIYNNGGTLEASGPSVSVFATDYIQNAGEMKVSNNAGMNIGRNIEVHGGEIRISGDHSYLNAGGDFTMTNGLVAVSAKTAKWGDPFTVNGRSTFTGGNFYTSGLTRFTGGFEVSGDARMRLSCESGIGGGTMTIDADSTVKDGGRFGYSTETATLTGTALLSFDDGGVFQVSSSRTVSGRVILDGVNVDFKEGSKIALNPGSKIALLDNDFIKVMESSVSPTAITGADRADLSANDNFLYEYYAKTDTETVTRATTTQYLLVGGREKVVTDPRAGLVGEYMKCGLDRETAEFYVDRQYARNLVGIAKADASNWSAEALANRQALLYATPGFAICENPRNMTGALAILSGYTAANALNSAMIGMNEIKSAISGRRGAALDCSDPCGDPCTTGYGTPAKANSLWVTALGSRNKQNSKDSALGYDYKSYGALIGYDRAFGQFVVGGAFGYTRGELENHGIRDDNKTDNFSFSLYGTYNHASGFFNTVIASYAYGDNDMRSMLPRQGWIDSKYHTNTFMIGDTLGYDFRLGRLSATPTLGLYYQEARTSSYTTRGIAFQKFDNMKMQSLSAPINLAVAYDVISNPDERLTVKVDGGYAYEFKNDAPKGRMTYVGTGIGSQSVRGMTPGRSTWNAGVGLQYKRCNFDMGVNYRYTGKSKYHGHMLEAGFGINF